MGGTSGSSDAQVQNLGSLSFVPALLSQFFLGTGIGTQGGGIQIIGDEDITGSSSLFREGDGTVISGPQAAQGNIGALLSNLTDLTNPNANPAIASGGVDILQQLGLSGGIQGANFLQGAAQDTFREGLETGFKPDLQPIIQQATEGFFNQIVPQLGQSNVALQEGVGPFSTDLSNQILKAGAGLATNLGALETQLQSEAGQRRAELSALSGGFASSLSGVPFQAGGQALDLGEQQILTGTAGGRQAQLLQLLAGLQPGGTGVRGSDQAQSNKGGGFFG